LREELGKFFSIFGPKGGRVKDQQKFVETHLSPFRRKSFRTRKLDQLLQPPKFRMSHGRAEFRDLIVSAALIVILWRRPPPRFHDQTLFLHPLDRTVQRSGAEFDLATRPRRYVLDDCVSVTLSISKCHQDVKGRALQGKQ
jgi:hypothetical protein